MTAALSSTAGFVAAFIFAQAVQAADTTSIILPTSILETATLLSGSVLPSGLPPQLKTERWQGYSNQVYPNWNQYVAKIANPMMAWSQKEAPVFRETVFYPFSGSDFSTVYRIYPNVRRDVMVAAQRAYQPIDLRTLNPATLDHRLNVLTAAWENYGRNGFVVTEHLDQYISEQDTFGRQDCSGNDIAASAFHDQRCHPCRME